MTKRTTTLAIHYDIILIIHYSPVEVRVVRDFGLLFYLICEYSDLMNTQEIFLIHDR